MAKLLASVMSVEEAQMALDGGADIVDCKDASTGALGALPNDRIAAIAKLANGRRPVSTTIGDVATDPVAMRDAVASRTCLGTDYIKIGFHSAANAEACIKALGQYTKAMSLIAVLFADKEPDLDILPLLSHAGFAGVMLDTADKANGGLRECVSHVFVSRFVARAKGLRLTTGLAGSLTLEDVPALLELDPDYLGFRGALCGGHRTGGVDPKRVAALAKAVHRPYRRARDAGSSAL